MGVLSTGRGDFYSPRIGIHLSLGARRQRLHGVQQELLSGLRLVQGMARRIHCLAVHPSRPHLCVTGASSGTLAVWDLRMTSALTVHSASGPGAGDVLEVGFCPRYTLDSPCQEHASLMRCLLLPQNGLHITLWPLYSLGSAGHLQTS